jgi:hypothetical protein
MRVSLLSSRIIALAAAYALVLQAMLVPVAAGTSGGQAAVSMLCRGPLPGDAGAPNRPDDSCCVTMGCQGGSAAEPATARLVRRIALVTIGPVTRIPLAVLDQEGRPQRTRAPPDASSNG